MKAWPLEGQDTSLITCVLITGVPFIQVGWMAPLRDVDGSGTDFWSFIQDWKAIEYTHKTIVIETLTINRRILNLIQRMKQGILMIRICLQIMNLFWQFWLLWTISDRDYIEHNLYKDFTLIIKVNLKIIKKIGFFRFSWPRDVIPLSSGCVKILCFWLTCTLRHKSLPFSWYVEGGEMGRF